MTRSAVCRLHSAGPDWRSRFEFLLQGTAEPRILSRGRAWLDALDNRLRRSVDELVVSDKTLPEPGAVRHSECEYTKGAFGILVPRRLVSDSDIRLPAGNEQ